MQHWANVASNIFHSEWLKDSAFVVVVVSLKCDLRKIENCLMFLDNLVMNSCMTIVVRVIKTLATAC